MVSKAEKLLESIENLSKTVPAGFFDVFGKKLAEARLKLLKNLINKHITILTDHPPIKALEEVEVKLNVTYSFPQYHAFQMPKSSKLYVKVRNLIARAENFQIELRLWNWVEEEEEEGKYTKYPREILLAIIYVSKNQMSREWEGDLSIIKVDSVHQSKGIAAKLLKVYNNVLRDLRDIKQTSISAVEIGRYAWTRVPGVAFASTKDMTRQSRGFKKWCTANGNCDSYDINSRDPSAYPKEYLLSKYSPEWMNYLIT